MRRSRIWVTLAIIAGVVVGCGNGSEGVTVGDVWGRPTPDAAANSAFYMTITGGSSNDTLVAATSDACGVTQLHETTMTDGSMSMQEVEGGIDVPAGDTVSLEPGGFHVMCMNLTEPLAIGDSVGVTLEFAEAGTVEVTAEIRDGSNSSDEMDMSTTSQG